MHGRALNRFKRSESTIRVFLLLMVESGEDSTLVASSCWTRSKVARSTMPFALAVEPLAAVVNLAEIDAVSQPNGWR